MLVNLCFSDRYSQQKTAGWLCTPIHETGICLPVPAAFSRGGSMRPTESWLRGWKTIEEMVEVFDEFYAKSLHHQQLPGKG